MVRYRTKIRQLENDLLFRLSNSQVRPHLALVHVPKPCVPMGHTLTDTLLDLNVYYLSRQIHAWLGMQT